MSLEALRQNFVKNERFYFDPIVSIDSKEIESLRKKTCEYLSQELNSLVIDKTNFYGDYSLRIDLTNYGYTNISNRPDYAFREVFIILDAWLAKLNIILDSIKFEHGFSSSTYRCKMIVTIDISKEYDLNKKTFISYDSEFEQCLRLGKWQEPKFQLLKSTYDIRKYRFFLYLELFIIHIHMKMIHLGNDLLSADVFDIISSF